MSTRIFVPGDAMSLALGADDVAVAITAEATSRGRDVTLVRNGSHGLFWLEPMIEIDVRGTRYAYGPVTADDVASLFDAGALEGADHPLALGRTSEIPALASQTRLTFQRVGVVDPRSLDDFMMHGGYAGLRRALEVGAEQILTDVETSGLRGRGGAAFPTGIKWRTVANAPATPKYVVANADEGDSGTFSDRMVMEGDPFGLIEGMTIAGFAVGASHGVVYIRSEYPQAIDAMRHAVAAAQESGWLGAGIGGFRFDFDVEIRVGAGAYICGEETSMLESPAARHRGPLRQAHRRQQRRHDRVGAVHRGPGR
jgi:formate dehydrogenase iron-sulfur subunit